VLLRRAVRGELWEIIFVLFFSNVLMVSRKKLEEIFMNKKNFSNDLCLLLSTFCVAPLNQRRETTQKLPNLPNVKIGRGGGAREE
jgi:hypothetical protein